MCLVLSVPEWASLPDTWLAETRATGDHRRVIDTGKLGGRDKRLSELGIGVYPDSTTADSWYVSLGSDDVATVVVRSRAQIGPRG